MQSNECAKIFLDVVPKIMLFIRKEMRQCAGADLTVPQFRVLIHLSLGASANLELAEAIGVRPSTMTRMVDLLARRSLVDRKSQIEDRRQIHITLTRDGVTMVENIQKNMRAIIANILETTDDSTREKINEGLLSIKELFAL